ncbi:protein Smaug homolog 1 [Galendromus occidentalis]|uniref:Protein Smaug n=1 Tax=Galendromus occidentalis TaxID=34638 RepID=A0AAJ6VXA3_9ACAR|nr:protein Smaug homolog 1 [Galendromus occidentalis]
MKSSGSFREQVATVSSWFDQWNPCEQTVALYSLLKKLGPVQGRFLGLCLSQQGLQASKDMKINEQNANDPGFVRGLDSASQLVVHLPLLRPGNDNAKQVYLEQIPIALSTAVDTCLEVEEARQLLSYALIHPALGSEERRALGLWLKHLEHCIASPQITHDSTNNNNNKHINVNHNNNNNNIINNNNNNSNNMNNNNNINNSINYDPAMKDVTGWLKTLRLHKYSPLLMSMSYDQMLMLNEDQLEAHNVTQGARNKLILNIKKLQQRQMRLQALQKDIECGNGDLKQIIEEVRSILVTPMKAYPQEPVPLQDDDIPREITRVLAKICSTLLTSPVFDHSLVPAYVQLLDRCLAHDQFCQTLKRRIYSWKQQIAKFGARRRPYTLPWMSKDMPGVPSRTANTLPFGTRPSNIVDPDYEDRLESLCLSVTEHAIGDTFHS